MNEYTEDQEELEIIRRLQASIGFGLDVEKFLAGQVGRFVIRKAEAEITQAVEALKTADAEDPKAIRRLQHQIAVGESIQRWFAEAIQAGMQAEQAFTHGH
jgi:hypothetical protein